MRIILGFLLGIAIMGGAAHANANNKADTTCHQTAPGKSVCNINLPPDTIHNRTVYYWHGTEQFSIDFWPVPNRKELR